MPNSADSRPRGTATRSIGQVLAVLRPDFPEISISKIRFLESEGLVSPQRAASGYRRYTDADVERLRYVLAVQREHYVPLQGDPGPPGPDRPGPDPAQPGLGAPAGRRRIGSGRRRPAAATAGDQGSRSGCPAQELLEASGLTEARSS